MTIDNKVIALRQAVDSQPLSMLFKAVGDVLRLQILRLLAHDSYSVSELCEIFSLRQSALSHHLKILVQANLLARKKEGTAIFYRRALSEGKDARLRNMILEEIDQETLLPAVQSGIRRVQHQREFNSVEFFRGHIQLFREQQELIAPWKDYSDFTLQLLERSHPGTVNSIVEIGVGEGWLLPELRKKSISVVALDLSRTMLDRAKAYAGCPKGVRFVEGGTDILVREGLKTEVVVANMVLHHTPDPQSVIHDTAKLLVGGGSLIVSELCAHDQAWAREYCGDLWLGFAAEQLQGWAYEAGLRVTANVFLAQRNGFQIQIHLFQAEDGK